MSESMRIKPEACPSPEVASINWIYYGDEEAEGEDMSDQTLIDFDDSCESGYCMT